MERNNNRMQGESAAALTLTHLSRKFGAQLAVDDLNLTVRRHELFGLMGVNGAGKTTTIKMICGLLTPTDGQVLVGDTDIVKDREKACSLLNLSPQETAVAENLTAEENLLLIAGLYGKQKAEAQESVRRIIDLLDLAQIAEKKSKHLSGGWKRRLSIAMALVTEPEILLLDEPTLGLDVLARRELWQVIRTLKNRITLVLTTHYLEEAEALCDRIAVMAGGRLRALGSPQELKAMAGTDSFEEAFIRLVREEETYA